MLRLASLFMDGAVVQREMPIVVWGWCAPRILVTAILGSSTATAPSSLDGRFEVRLPSLPAGGPYELVVKAGEYNYNTGDAGGYGCCGRFPPMALFGFWCKRLQFVYPLHYGVGYVNDVGSFYLS